MTCLSTKPVSLQFITSFKRLELGGMIPNAIGGFILIVIAWKRLHIHTTFNTISIFSFYIIMGCIASYALYMLPYLISFWTVKAHNIIQVSYSIWDFNNMPMHIYKRWIQEIGFYIIPIFIVTNPAPSIVLGLFDRNKNYCGYYYSAITFINKPYCMEYCHEKIFQRKWVVLLKIVCS